MFPPTLEETSQQVNSASNGMDDHNYITDDDFLRDLHFRVVFVVYSAVGGLPGHPPVALCYKMYLP